MERRRTTQGDATMTLLEMSAEEHENFMQEGCEPTCHICKKKIPVFGIYQMRHPWPPKHAHEHTVTVEVMTCGDCEDKPLPKNEVERIRRYLDSAEEDLEPQPKWVVEDNLRRARLYEEARRARECGISLGCVRIDGKVIPGMA